MAKLWGNEVGDVPPGSADGEPVPVRFNDLSKRCRRLLLLALQKGRVQPKGNATHFDRLVRWGLLNDDGQPTDAGRRLYRAGTQNSG